MNMVIFNQSLVQAYHVTTLLPFLALLTILLNWERQEKLYGDMQLFILCIKLIFITM